MSGRRPVEAISRQQARAELNRQKIADALSRAQANGDRINISAIAAAAAVDPGTIRNNPDLLTEIKRLRDGQGYRPPSNTRTTDAASYKEMQARWMTAQAEISDLRRDLKQARESAHQALGISAARVEPTELEQVQQRVAELEVQQINMTQTQQETAAQLRDATAQLTDCHELNRDYLRQLEQAKRELQRAKQQINAKAVSSR
jgi:hypothetical protein